MIFNFLLCSKLFLISGIFYFFHRRALKIASFN